MNILITGGTGLIGTEISKQLLQKGHTVIYYSRRPGKNNLGVREYHWDPDKEQLDTEALFRANAIINLAGASTNKRWTPEYKNTILRSRVDSTRLLFNTVQQLDIRLKAFISASAIGYYPNDLQKEYTEKDSPGHSFLSLVCQKCEAEAENFRLLGVRTAICRIGVALSNRGGALPLMALPVRFGVGAPLGSGRQWMPWIHLEDLAGMFIHILEQQGMMGIYNATAPHNVTNEELTRTIARVYEKPLFFPNVPAFALKLILGERAITALGSHKVSSRKIRESGFSCKYPELYTALQSLLKK